MKIHPVLLCALLVPSPSAWAAPAKQQRAARPLSVVDYFRLLPADSYKSEFGGRGWRYIVERTHGYLKISGEKEIGDGRRPTLQCKVFRFGRSDVVALSTYKQGEYGFGLWRYEDKRWSKVTSNLVPPVEGDDLNYVLPRTGTTLRVFLSDGTLSTKLYWRAGRFVAEDVLGKS